MQGDYIASGDAVNDKPADFPLETPEETSHPPHPDTPDAVSTGVPGSPDTPPSGDQAPPSYTPPFTFDDPDILAFYRADGPYLDLQTDAAYRALMRCLDPETGWAMPSHDDLVYLSKLKSTTLRKHLNIVCDELGKFTMVERRSPDKGSLPTAYFLNAWPTGLVPSPMTAATEDPLGEARKIIAQQKMDSLRAEMDYEIEAREMHIEQLKAQIEAMGVNPVVPSESAEPPLRAAPPLRANPPLPPLPEEPPPPDFRDVDQWVDENWTRLKTGGVKSFIGYRNWIRSHQDEIATQMQQWEDEDRANHRPSQSHRPVEPERYHPTVREDPTVDPSARELWRSVLSDLQMQLPRPTFETWIKPTTGVAIEEGDPSALIVTAPTPFALEWLERRIYHSLQRTLEKVAGKPMTLNLQVRNEGARTASSDTSEEEPYGSDDPADRATGNNESDSGGEGDSDPGGEPDA